MTKPATLEEHHRDRIGAPGLVLGLVDAAAPIDEAFDRAQYRAQKRPLTREDACHVAAERLRDRDDDHAEQHDLQPAVGNHLSSSLVAAGQQPSSSQTDQGLAETMFIATSSR